MADQARPVGRPRTSPAPDGYYDPDVVAARRLYMQQYKVVNSASLKAYYKAWREANPDKHRQYNREWAARDRARRAQANQRVGQELEARELQGRPEPPVDPEPIPPAFAPEPVD